jgi:hypothetical protein
MKNEVCRCGSRELEIWKRQRVGKGIGGQKVWFAHCLACGHRAEALARGEVTSLMRAPTHTIGMEWSDEEESEYARMPAR